MEVSVSFPYIVLALHEYVLDMLPTAAVARLESWITCHPNVRIFRDTSILVVISYLILLDINLSFLWLAIFPVMAIVFIGALYFKFSRLTGGIGEGTPGSSNVDEKTKRQTRELKIIVMMALGALFVMDQLRDQAAKRLAMSQFLMFLSSTVAALTHMMMKVPGSASLPGIAVAAQMLHKTLLLLLLVTAHTVPAEWLGEDVVLLCLPEVIPVVLWLSLHPSGKPGSSSTIISIDKIKQHRRSLSYLSAVVAPLIAHLAISKDEFVLSSWCTTFLLSCGVSAILTFYLVFMLSHWPTQQAAPALAAKDGASGMLKLWAYALLISAAVSLLLKCLVSLRLDLQQPLNLAWQGDSLYFNCSN